MSRNCLLSCTAVSCCSSNIYLFSSVSITRHRVTLVTSAMHKHSFVDCEQSSVLNEVHLSKRHRKLKGYVLAGNTIGESELVTFQHQKNPTPNPFFPLLRLHWLLSYYCCTVSSIIDDKYEHMHYLGKKSGKITNVC